MMANGHKEIQGESTRHLTGVDVVIPVHGAAASFARCLASVLLHSDLPPNRLIVVVDGPQTQDVEEVLSGLLRSDPEFVQVVRQPVRRGFVSAVNRGIAHSDRDVVLLNSDTEVTRRWIDKLHEAAHSSPGIATVTPLSNSATICSLPEFLEDNLMPAGVSTEMLGAAVDRVSRCEYPRLPTGVGVCLYIRREVIEAIGSFDESRFGLGYGEENEFCIRATKAGFEHIADDATFVFHEGQKSFGPEKTRLTKRGMRVLRSIDPTYLPRVARFIQSDPLAGIRSRIVDEIRRPEVAKSTGTTDRRQSILHIVHGWPPFDTGGTEQYARELARHQTQRHRISVFARIADRDRITGQRIAYLDEGIRVRMVVNNFDRRNPLARNALRDPSFERELVAFLQKVKPDIVHVHHLAGLSASLMGVIASRRFPMVYQIQDWWALCSRANLWRSDNTLCPGPKPDRCAECLPLTTLPPSWVLNRALYRLRRRLLRRQLRKADAYVMGSRAVRAWYVDAGFLDRGAPVHVVEYGVGDFSVGRVPSNRVARPVTFGFIGSLMPHKGACVAVEAFRGVDSSTARLQIWGNPDADPDYTTHLLQLASSGPVELRGRFGEAEKGAILGSIDVLVIPSVGMESFGIVAREAMAAGVPILASRRGALEELAIDGVCGATFAPGDADELRGWIGRIVEDPEILENWRQALPKPISMESHAADIDEIYRQVLEKRR